MGKNQNTWSHRTKIIFREIKIIFHPLGSTRQSYRFLTGKCQRRSKRIIFWDNVPIDLKYVCQQYFTCMCSLGFIRYNKTFIACRFRKYENLFTHEYHIPLGRCPQGIWYSWVNKFSYFPHQHAIYVYNHRLINKMFNHRLINKMFNHRLINKMFNHRLINKMFNHRLTCRKNAY
jgi:hypothetical protein